jgi:hypothetical protein
MTNHRVRIYEGAPERSTIVGFSKSIAGTPDDIAFVEFMSDRGYEWTDTRKRPMNSRSWRHVEVRPPLTMLHTMELGALCVGGFIGDVPVVRIVDSHNDVVFVTDHRAESAIGTLGEGQLIASG